MGSLEDKYADMVVDFELEKKLEQLRMHDQLHGPKRERDGIEGDMASDDVEEMDVVFDAKLGSNGRLTVPEATREKWLLKPGDIVTLRITSRVRGTPDEEVEDEEVEDESDGSFLAWTPAEGSFFIGDAPISTLGKIYFERLREQRENGVISVEEFDERSREVMRFISALGFVFPDELERMHEAGEISDERFEGYTEMMEDDSAGHEDLYETLNLSGAWEDSDGYTRLIGALEDCLSGDDERIEVGKKHIEDMLEADEIPHILDLGVRATELLDSDLNDLKPEDRLKWKSLLCDVMVWRTSGVDFAELDEYMHNARWG